MDLDKMNEKKLWISWKWMKMNMDIGWNEKK